MKVNFPQTVVPTNKMFSFYLPCIITTADSAAPHYLPIPANTIITQTCQVSRNVHESPETMYKISRKRRNVGNLINILFFCNKACFWCESDAFGVNPRDVYRKDLKLAQADSARMTIASALRLNKHA